VATAENARKQEVLIPNQMRPPGGSNRHLPVSTNENDATQPRPPAAPPPLLPFARTHSKLSVRQFKDQPSTSTATDIHCRARPWLPFYQARSGYKVSCRERPSADVPPYTLRATKVRVQAHRNRVPDHVSCSRVPIVRMPHPRCPCRGVLVVLVATTFCSLRKTCLIRVTRL
jgi:hypothetical protein